MLKLVLNSINIDLGWNEDKCYSNVKDMPLSLLLAMEERDIHYTKDWQLCDPVIVYEDSELLNSRLEYYVFDVYFEKDDIPALDIAMSNIKTVLDRGALVLFDSYDNYIKAKEMGTNTFKLVTSNLADYDWASNSVVKLADSISLKEDMPINLVVYDYVNKCLNTIPFTSMDAEDTDYDNIYLFNCIPMLFKPPYISTNLDMKDCNVSLALFKSLYFMLIIGECFKVVKE